MYTRAIERSAVLPGVTPWPLCAAQGFLNQVTADGSVSADA